MADGIWQTVFGGDAGGSQIINGFGGFQALSRPIREGEAVNAPNSNLNPINVSAKEYGEAMTTDTRSIDGGLLPCPFCGGKAQHKNCRGGEDSMLAWVVCVNCGAMTEQFEDAYAPTQQAESEWNRRTQSEDAQHSQSGVVEAERSRLADILWARGMTHEDLKERSGWLLAATVVRRGRELTDEEKLRNLFDAMSEDEAKDQIHENGGACTDPECGICFSQGIEAAEEE